MTRVVYGSIGPKELKALEGGLRLLPGLKEKLSGVGSLYLKEIFRQLDPLEDVADCISCAIREDPPSLLPQMVERLQTGEWDSVATRRVTRKGEPPIRSFCARMFYKLINRISDADVVDGARDFRLMTREMVDAIVSMGEFNRFSKGIFEIGRAACRDILYHAD